MGRVARLSAACLVVAGLVPGLAGPAAARTIEPAVGRVAGSSLGRVSPEQPRLLIRFRPGASAAERDRAVASVGGSVDRVLDAIGVTRVAVPVPSTEDQTGLRALRLSGDPAVLSVEPDASGSLAFTPNDRLYLTDPLFGLGQWGLRATQVDKAWDIVRGSPLITVAVIDTGIDPNHPDLAGVALPGATFVTSPSSTCDPASTIDDNGHGTHVAGVIGANGNNGQGVAGVAFGVRILPVKALDCLGVGLLSDVASAVTWATDHGARIINVSLGSSASQTTLQDAIRYAVAHNVFVVAAAGNCGVLSTNCPILNEPQYPGAFPESFAVAATDPSDQHASFSNSGSYVAVAAPGVKIWSTVPTYSTTLSRSGSPQTYAAFSGTSQASPMVAGIAALVLSREPGLSVAQLADRLRTTADDLGPPGFDITFGAGRVNALRAVSANASVRYGAAYGVTSVPRSATIGAPLTAPVTITNTSSFAWPTGGLNPVRLAYHWTDLANSIVVWDGQRTALPADVAIGGAVTVQAAVAVPKSAGSYVLHVDLVREGVTWFSANGVSTGDVSIAVSSGLAASYAPVASAQSTFVLGPNPFNVLVTNTGTVTWPAAGPTPVHLSYHWLDQVGQVVVWDGARASLPADIAPGQPAVVAMQISSPPAIGNYTLRIDLVQEGVSWFSAQGVTPRDIRISVTTGVGASYSFVSPATAVLPGSRTLIPVTLTNTGITTWPAGGPNPFRAAAHLSDGGDQLLVWDGERAVLPADVAPGQRVTVQVPIAVPASPSAARFLFRIDLVREGIAWISSYGVTPAVGAINADLDYRASFTLASRSVSRSAPSVTVTITNTSQVTWTPGGTAPLDVSSHWLASDGTLLVWDGPRAPLVQQPAGPGATLTISLPLAAPPAGASLLVIDVVAEGLRWFGSGSPQPVTLVP